MRWSNLASGRFMPRDAFPRKRRNGDIDHQPRIYLQSGRCARDKVFSGDTILL